MHFNLDKAIAAWRRSFKYRRAFFDDDLEELERHLRDHVALLINDGWELEEAFREAQRHLGEWSAMESEYRKVFWAKVKHKRGLLQEIWWDLTMLANYFKVALRNLRRQKGHAFINITGLSVGIACCLLIMLYIFDEVGYDRYHEKADRIFRVVMDAQVAGDKLDDPVTAVPMARTLVDRFSEVEAASRLEQRSGVMVRYEDKSFREDRVFFADSSMFDILSIPLIHGEASRALVEPNTLVLTESTARRYFDDANPMGKILTIDGDDFRVTAVAADLPSRTHFHFDFLASFTTLPYSENDMWFPLNYYTYVALHEGYNEVDLEAKFPDLVASQMGSDIEKVLGMSYDEFVEGGNFLRFHLQPIPDIHLYSNYKTEIEANGDITYVYLFSAIAFLILLIACINFMNLSTARSSSRAREVGMRKVLGSFRRQLVQQFLGESILMSAIAMILACGLVVLFLPSFSELAGKQLDLGLFENGWVWLGLIGFASVVGLIAGSYPALFLASFRPVVVLKGKLGVNSGRSRLRGGMVVFQFAASIVLIVGTLVVYNQLQYIQETKLGFEKEHVVVVDNVWALGQQRDAYKQAILQSASVSRASAAHKMPGDDYGRNAYWETSREHALAWPFQTVDEDFVETLNIELVVGRDFSPDFPSDSASIMLNEAAVRDLGWDDPIGKVLEAPELDNYPTKYTVIGVVKDFHYQSLHNEIFPLVIHPNGVWGNVMVMAVRIEGQQISETLAMLEEQWQAFVPDEPFSYSFLDQDFDNLYQAEQRTGVTFAVFSILGILVACLGLFGLAAFMAEQRTKEVGVRKALGASVASVVILVTQDFVKLIGLAFVVAVPIAYFGMNHWLEDFAFRVDIGVGTFLFAGGLALTIALLTISYQAIKAAVADPVKALRYE